MSDNEMAIIVLSIIFGSVIGIIAIVKIFDVIKSWIERNNNSYDEEAFDKLAKAFIQYKRESERRFQNLEAIVIDDQPKSSERSSRQLKESQLHNTIEIDSDETKQESEKRNKQSGGGNLRNMLKD